MHHALLLVPFTHLARRVFVCGRERRGGGKFSFQGEMPFGVRVCVCGGGGEEGANSAFKVRHFFMCCVMCVLHHVLLIRMRLQHLAHAYSVCV